MIDSIYFVFQERQIFQPIGCTAWRNMNSVAEGTPRGLASG
ncbi:unnamed protein product [Penicillium roqueforti FM164]|uniref:Genomic scaffold, ProqFM164S02 n=1 Tax=Penicillium roqueforti (strain FM164) TaxID=1365484 RepID=W6Q3G0_PENRF|nr:unnamed protein product [Penicillium roqueforti FM164]